MARLSASETRRLKIRCADPKGPVSTSAIVPVGGGTTTASFEGAQVGAPQVPEPGTSALIYVDGLEAPVKGRVRWVSSEAAFTPYYALTERDRGRLSYVAKVDVAESRERLPDGVPVEVEFLLDEDG